jgi:hypothetical protein
MQRSGRGVEKPLHREIYYLDKLIDELAKASRWRRFCGRDRP